MFPSTRSRNPPAHILAVLQILRAKLVAKRRFFVEEDEKIHQDDDCERIYHQPARELGKENPAAKQDKPSPEVHRIADITVGPADHQMSRRVKRSWSSFSLREKIEETAYRDNGAWDEQ